MQRLETNTHQDHVIAHVIGATVLGHYSWDETLYVLLDIGFIWHIYLDCEMGLAPHPVVIAELELPDVIKNQLAADVEALLTGVGEVRYFAPVAGEPIDSVELFELENTREIHIACGSHYLKVQTNLTARTIIAY
jgi:hypothetical protein